MSFEDVLGATTRTMWNNRNGVPGNIFFKPYRSPVDFFSRITSIATDPVLLVLGSVGCVVVALVDFLKGVGHLLITADLSSADDNFQDCGAYLLTAVSFLVMGALSIVLNLAHLIAGGIASLKNSPAVEEVEEVEEMDNVPGL